MDHDNLIREKILFLDIDGVLNDHHFCEDAKCGQIHRDKVSLLNDVLRSTDAKIVLSSAWRYIVHRGEATLAGIDWLLKSHGVYAGRLIGITRPDTVTQTPYDGTPGSWVMSDERGSQIADWLNDHRPARVTYAVVDDLDLGITVARHPFVQTQSDVGLTSADAQKLVDILGRK